MTWQLEGSRKSSRRHGHKVYRRLKTLTSKSQNATFSELVSLDEPGYEKGKFDSMINE